MSDFGFGNGDEAGSGSGFGDGAEPEDQVTTVEEFREKSWRKLSRVGVGRKSDEDWASVGIFYEYLDKAGPRSVNGWPSFLSMRLMHVDDWERCRKAIVREQERQERIEV